LGQKGRLGQIFAYVPEKSRRFESKAALILFSFTYGNQNISLIILSVPGIFLKIFFKFSRKCSKVLLKAAKVGISVSLQSSIISKLTALATRKAQ